MTVPAGKRDRLAKESVLQGQRSNLRKAVSVVMEVHQEGLGSAYADEISNRPAVDRTYRIRAPRALGTRVADDESWLDRDGNGEWLTNPRVNSV